MFRVFRVLKDLNFKDSRVVPKDLNFKDSMVIPKDLNFKDSRVVPKDLKDSKDPKDLRDLKSQPRQSINLSPGCRSVFPAILPPFLRRCLS